MNCLKMIAWITTAIVVLFSVFSTESAGTYKFAPLFLAPLLWSVYFLRKPLYLQPLPFTLYALALLLHNLGAFGFYRKLPLGVEFDIYVHFYFGFAAGLLLAQAFEHNFHFPGWRLWIAVVVFLLGIGGFHELIEYASTLILGPEKGMLKANDPDKFDTHKDLLNNFLGALLAMTVYSFSRRSGKASAPAPNSRGPLPRPD